MTTGLDLSQLQRQKLQLGQGQLQSLALLAMSLPELRAEVNAEMERNPLIESVDHPLETPLSEIEKRRSDDAECAESQIDYPEDDTYSPVTSRSRDEDYEERRQAFFDNQTAEETLQQHLTAQLPLSDITPEDHPLAELLIGELDVNGYYHGTLAEAAQAYLKPLEEVEAVLAKIRELDPPGCGARTPQECFLAQLDDISDVTLRLRLGKLLKDPSVDLQAVCAADPEVFGALKGLNWQPGRSFPNEKDRVEYVNPEITAVKRGGRWLPMMDERSIPEFRLSKHYLKLLRNPGATEEERSFFRQKLAAAKALREAIENRQSTVSGIASAVFERQQEFFEKGFSALRPLTELEVAEKVGVSGPTVSKTVRDKYVATPRGTIELRRFFTAGVKTAGGEEVSQEAVLRALRDLVHGENPAAPLSDEKLSAALNARGFVVARRTVAKYRDKLGIPGASARRKA